MDSHCRVPEPWDSTNPTCEVGNRGQSLPASDLQFSSLILFLRLPVRVKREPYSLYLGPCHMLGVKTALEMGWQQDLYWAFSSWELKQGWAERGVGLWQGHNKSLSHSHRELWSWDNPSELSPAGRGSQAFGPLHCPVIGCHLAPGRGRKLGEATVFRWGQFPVLGGKVAAAGGINPSF